MEEIVLGTDEKVPWIWVKFGCDVHHFVVVHHFVGENPCFLTKILYILRDQPEKD